MVGGVPNIKAAIKWTRQSEKRTGANLGAKTRLKTLFKKAKEAGSLEAVPSVERAFDKAAQKGIIHPNKAARKKSRLAKAVRTAAAAAVEGSTAKPARSRAKK
jgi:small subunit ribosomal protein S20